MRGSRAVLIALAVSSRHSQEQDAAFRASVVEEKLADGGEVWSLDFKCTSDSTRPVSAGVYVC